ncbi:MAG TPA: class I SAM-dependent methyltransferase [Aestuariivirga sp.]|nr:class I SAM-dependent methyltransferase [Aestuariivirga sp.]
MPDLSSLLDPFRMGEDLPAQLDMVRRLAPLHCVSCDGYHLVWAERRAKIDRETELFYNPEFMSNILAGIGRLHGAGHRTIKIFIAGSADTKLLAACAYAVHVQKYFTPDAADFHIMDACETPLQLARAYAGRFGLRVTTTTGTMPDAIPDLSANLIIVSGLLRFIPYEEKALFLKRMKSLLSNGGAMAFTQSIRLNDDPAPARFECSDPADLRNLFDQAGFVIEREATTKIGLISGSKDRRNRTRYSVLATSGLQ